MANGRRRSVQAGPPAANAVAVADPFQHVIVLMMENRSFDHILGALRATFNDLDGVDPANPGVNVDDAGNSYSQQPVAATVTSPDPLHDTSDVLLQIDGGGHGANGGFVIDYLRTSPPPPDPGEVMNYFPNGRLYATHALATEFAVCDKWFASVPGPTWTNRFFVHSGTSMGRVKMPSGISHPNLHLYDQTTLYDRLNAQNVKWKIYAGDIPQSLVLSHQWQPKNARCYSKLSNFFSDVTHADTFPQYAFIEPHYFGGAQDDDHPSSNVLKGEALIAQVYNAIRNNDALWKSTLFVLMFDEHGGFYDHVSPGPAIPPDAHHEEYTFDRYGVRTPTVLVSPWLGAQRLHNVYDHTSLLKYLTHKWSLGDLGRRTAAANSFANEWTLGAVARANVLPRIDIPMTIQAFGAESTETELNEHQQALLAFSDFLETQIETAPAEVKAERAVMAAASPQSHAAVAQRRVDQFLEQQARKP